MRKFLLCNLIMMIVVFLFYIMNNSAQEVIYFYPYQSSFSRFDYLLFVFVSAGLIWLLLTVLTKLSKRIEGATLYSICKYEIVVLYIVFFISTLFYIYVSHFHLPPLITNFEFHRPFMGFIIFYYIELILMCVLLVNTIRNINSFKRVNQIIHMTLSNSKRRVLSKVVEGLLITLSFFLPYYIDGSEVGFSLYRAQFFTGKVYLVLLLIAVYVGYFVVKKPAYKIGFNLIQMFILYVILLSRKNVNNYFMTERLHYGAEWFIGAYLLVIVVIFIFIDTIYLLTITKNKTHTADMIPLK